MRITNVPMRVILGLPLKTPLSRRLMMANIVGRRTGKVYRQPLSYVQEGADTLLTPGGGRWKLNLRADRSVTLRIAGRDVTARPEVVGDPDEVCELISVIVAANPGGARFIGVGTDAAGKPDRTAVERVVGFGFRIVRWHLGAESGAET